MRWFVAFNLLLFFAVALIVITGLRRYTGLMKKWGPSTLLFLLALAAARLLFPVDFYAAHSIKSRKILVAVMFFLEENGRVLLAVWGIGTAAVLVIDACVLVRAHRQARRYAAVDLPWAAQAAQRLGVKCPVVVSPDVETPYVSGFFRHTVYLPDQELSGRELELILSHELAHIRSHDAQIKLAFGLLSAVLWWVPGVYLFRSELDTILELRCDQKVTERMEPAGRAAYAEMLLNMMKGGKKRRRPALSVDESNVLGRPDVMR